MLLSSHLFLFSPFVMIRLNDESILSAYLREEEILIPVERFDVSLFLFFFFFLRPSYLFSCASFMSFRRLGVTCTGQSFSFISSLSLSLFFLLRVNICILII